MSTDPGAGGPEEAEADEVTLLRRRDGEVMGTASESWAGSTMIARRESRRRSARSAADPAAPGDPLAAAAVVPVRAAVGPATDIPGYPARTAEAVIVPRRPARPRDPAAAAEVPPPPGQAARRLAARRLLVVVGGGAAMVVVGVVLLIVLLAIG
jgi:hypothetical protein